MALLELFADWGLITWQLDRIAKCRLRTGAQRDGYLLYRIAGMMPIALEKDARFCVKPASFQWDTTRQQVSSPVREAKWPTGKIAALLASCGQGILAPPLCCKFLKTERFPANLRLAGKQTCSCHFDPVYAFTA